MCNRLVVLTILLLGLVLAAGCGNPFVIGDSLDDFQMLSRPPVRLHNNPSAVNVSFNELLAFLDGLELKEGICIQQAGELHDTAEASGIKAGVLAMRLPKSYHAINVFNTTDAGKIYIDYHQLPRCFNWQSLQDYYISVGERYEFW